jgi:acetyl-CoA carboxylase carboxyltransferase component
MGACAGGAAYNPTITDFIFMKKGAYMCVTGPSVIKEELKVDITSEELGGWKMHTRKSGAGHYAGATELDVLAATRKLMSFLP